ncbi:MAG: hypothetical protein U0840_28820 [Gemmataceae bacterium]
MSNSFARCIAVGFTFLLGVGCSGGGTLNPVKGKVLRNGQPLPGALVTFHPKAALNDIKAERSTGLTKDDGTFTVETGPKTGAPTGEYVVTIICIQSAAPPKAGSKDKPQITFGSARDDSTDILRGMYANVNNSQITVTVKSGPNELEPFNLK